MDCGDGWEALETTIRLSGWSRERRVVLVRCAAVPEAGRTRRGRDRQGLLPHAEGEGWDAQATLWSGKIAVLVLSLDPLAYSSAAMPGLYRDRADGENCFDELKNQWGWGGFTSRRLASSRPMANLVALFYNDGWAENGFRTCLRTLRFCSADENRPIQTSFQPLQPWSQQGREPSRPFSFRILV